jgi:hypothetical protein
MLTSGDVQFEPTAAAKILALSNSMFLMTAGDAGLQAEICSHVLIEVAERIRQEPGKWWFVRDVADLYIEHYNRIQLAPLYLDPSSFIANQHSMNERLVNDTARELLNFQMPSISTIFAGHDPAGPHIYLVSESGANSLEANCLDGVGFAAIGSGARHASSQIMVARHAWNAPMAETLFLTYYSKKKSEVAPGVGRGTDMVMSGPTTASLVGIRVEAIQRLEIEYQRVAQQETRAFSKAKGSIQRYVEDLQKQAQGLAEQQEQTPPKASGEPAPANGQPKV